MNSSNEEIFLSQEEAQKRYDICKKCEYFLITTQCSKCLCFMKVKVKISQSKCPIDKWDNLNKY